MARFNVEHDVTTRETEQPETILCNLILSLEDVTLCTINGGNIAPSRDKITVRLLKACWETIGIIVKNFFQACLDLCFSTFAFKVAEVIILSKQGCCLTLPKRWRPISLLFCLGKGLERFIAKRMAWLAIQHQVVSKLFFGSFLK